MTANDIRWIQRLNNYSKALGQLTKFIEKGELNELEKQGLIQAFEYTFELAWNTTPTTRRLPKKLRRVCRHCILMNLSNCMPSLNP